MHVIVTTKDQEVCKESALPGSLEDYCSDWAVDYYLRMYGVLLGEFNLDDYSDPRLPLLSAIFFLFTIVGVIILLNVLIAGTSRGSAGYAYCDRMTNSAVTYPFTFGCSQLSVTATPIPKIPACSFLVGE